jgi:recombination protein RecT
MVVDQCSNKFNEIASQGKLVTWAEESLFATQAITANETLSKCNVQTIQDSIVNVASIGLTLNPAMGYAYLVPEKGRCGLKVSFKGLLKIANESGSIVWAKAEVVRQSDVFTYKGPCDKPTHEINPFSGDRGPMVGVYCIAKTFDGDYLVDLMDLDEINKIKGCAKTKYVWDKWPEEMAKKAVIKRAAKQWPRKDQNNRLDTAIKVINDTEGSEAIEKDITPQINPEFIGRFHQLIGSTDSVGLVYFIDELKTVSKYSNESYDEFITMQKQLYATVPRGQKGETEALFKNLYDEGQAIIIDNIKEAIENGHNDYIAEYYDCINYKNGIYNGLNPQEQHYINNRG